MSLGNIVLVCYGIPNVYNLYYNLDCIIF